MLYNWAYDVLRQRWYYAANSALVHDIALFAGIATLGPSASTTSILLKHTTDALFMVVRFFCVFYS